MKVKLSFFIAYLGSAPVKGASKMLMKLTPGIILTNVLPAAFKCADHKSAKKTSLPFRNFQDLGV